MEVLGRLPLPVGTLVWGFGVDVRCLLLDSVWCVVIFVWCLMSSVWCLALVLLAFGGLCLVSGVWCLVFGSDFFGVW